MSLSLLLSFHPSSHCINSVPYHILGELPGLISQSFFHLIELSYLFMVVFPSRLGYPDLKDRDQKEVISPEPSTESDI